MRNKIKNLKKIKKWRFNTLKIQLLQHNSILFKPRIYWFIALGKRKHYREEIKHRRGGGIKSRSIIYTPAKERTTHPCQLWWICLLVCWSVPLVCIKTRPDTRLPQLRAGGQGPYLRSVEHSGRSSMAKNPIHSKKVKRDGRMDRWTYITAGCNSNNSLLQCCIQHFVCYSRLYLEQLIVAYNILFLSSMLDQSKWYDISTCGVLSTDCVCLLTDRRKYDWQTDHPTYSLSNT